jgi:hypothetical protein
MQHTSKTAKILKYISECIFHRTKLMAMTIPLWQATQMVSHLGWDTCRCPSRSAEPLSASSNTRVMVPQKTWRCTRLYTFCLKYKVQTDTILTPYNAQYYKVIFFTLSTLTQQVPNLHRFKCAVCRYRHSSCLVMLVFIWIVSALLWSLVTGMQCINYHTLKYASYCT